MMENHDIRCTVDSCKFNDRKQYCTLESIQVGSTSAAGKVRSSRDTECDSFIQS